MSPLTEYVLQTLVTLLGVSLLAFVVLVGARRLGVGRPVGPLTLVGRLGLDGRRAVYLVRAGQQLYVLGGSEAGLTKLGELAADELEPGELPPLDSPQERPRFAAVLARALGRDPGRAPPPAAEERDG